MNTVGNENLKDLGSADLARPDVLVEQVMRAGEDAFLVMKARILICWFVLNGWNELIFDGCILDVDES